MYEQLETTKDIEVASEALGTLLFETSAPTSAIETSLKTHTSEYFDIKQLIDHTAKKYIPLLRQNSQSWTGPFPTVLESWKGDFREGTDTIYEIAAGKDVNQADAVREYQSHMRSELPPSFILVRGTSSVSDDQSLTSWTARVGAADIYGETIYTAVVTPSDVFMSSVYGKSIIGESEYVLTNWSTRDTYDTSVSSFLQIYREMYNFTR